MNRIITPIILLTLLSCDNSSQSKSDKFSIPTSIRSKSTFTPIKIFEDVDATLKRLSQLNIGTMETWKTTDSINYKSKSGQYTIGTNSSMELFAEGTKYKVDKVSIVLTIGGSIKYPALDSMKKYTANLSQLILGTSQEWSKTNPDGVRLNMDLPKFGYGTSQHFMESDNLKIAIFEIRAIRQ